MPSDLTVLVLEGLSCVRLLDCLELFLSVLFDGLEGH